LRRYLIVQEHKVLPYPEGTACAEILIAGDVGGAKAQTVFLGVGISALYKLLMGGAKLWKETSAWLVTGIKGMEISADLTPALLGVGFIIGPRIASYMLAGAVLGYLVLSPLIAFIGQSLAVPIPPATDLISMLSPADIRSYYIRYIGAGAVAAGGMISLIKACPVIYRCFKVGFKGMSQGLRFLPDASMPRTDKDIPMPVVIAGAIVVALAMLLIPQTKINIFGTLIVVVFSFFFVTVASRIVGIVGSSSSPVSGMTIATLLVTCLIFLAFGWKGMSGMIGVMSVGSVVCIAICMAGDASQDLKTGYLVGATPFSQQIAEFIGVLAPAIFMGGVLMLLHKTMVIGSDKLPAPQASLMSFVVKGVLTGTLPWTFVGLGVLIGIAVEILGITALPFAIGLYLPLSLSVPVMTGAVIFWAVTKTGKNMSPVVSKAREASGILYSSGLVAGDALMSIVIAAILTIPFLKNLQDKLPVAGWLGPLSTEGSALIFVLLCVSLVLVARGRSKKK
jgi:putative OPT family oligopeptide transporter